MNEHQERAIKSAFNYLASVTITLIVAIAYCVTKPQQLGPEYVTIDGKQMRCVAIMVTQTETAASCDWDAIREAE